MVRAALQQVFVQSDEKSAHATWREVAHQLEKRFPAVTQMMDEAEVDMLTYFSFPKSHRVKLHSTNTLKRLNKEVKRRADVVTKRASCGYWARCWRSRTRNGSCRTVTCLNRTWRR